MPRFDDSVAYAANWKTVLVADAATGLAGVVLGVIVMAWVHLVVGALFVALGAAYLGVVGRRALHWAALRHEAGL